MSPDPRLPVRAGRVLRVWTVWVIPLVVASIAVAVMTTFYVSSVADPLAHLQGLPVGLANQDQGAAVGSRTLDIGSQVESGLVSAPKVSGPLHLEVSSLSRAQQAMDSDDLYATLVIPPNFTGDLLAVSGIGAEHAGTPAAPRIEILTNQRAGTVGSQLATGLLQPALASASERIGRSLTALAGAGAQTAATRVFLANPITVTIAVYRPLPTSAALGLSAFYIALLTMLCGFLGATTTNSVVDSALGYATNDTGPRWRQRRPLPIDRWQTLLVKWAVVSALTPVLAAVVVAVAGGGLGLDTPYPALLWLYTWLCAESVAIGTIVLFAAVGNYGQLIALMLFVYAGLASAGGTVPVEALPGPLRGLSNVEPLRQILVGTRSILYFGARADAGLARGTLEAGLGLILWLAIGVAVVRWYDRRRFYRLHPDVIQYVDAVIEDHQSRATEADGTPGSPGHAPGGKRPGNRDEPQEGED